MNKSSALNPVRQSIVSVNGPKEGKEQVNFSMFGSVKSHQSDSQSIHPPSHQPIIPQNPRSILPNSGFNFSVFESILPSEQQNSISNVFPYNQPHINIQAPSIPKNIINFDDHNPFNSSLKSQSSKQVHLEHTLPKQNAFSNQKHPIDFDQFDNFSQNNYSDMSSTQFFHKQDSHQIAIPQMVQKQNKPNQKPNNYSNPKNQSNPIYIATKKFNNIISTLDIQSQNLNQLTSQSRNFLSLQKNTINIFMKQLQHIKYDLLNLTNYNGMDDSSDSSYLNQNEISSIINGLQSQQQMNKSKITSLIQRIKKIQQLISMFTQQIKIKRLKIKQDPYYKITSPLLLNNCFKKCQQNKINQINILHPKQIQSYNPTQINSKFYINQKFAQNASYKKLFAPKNTIKHKSSFVQISFDYSFQYTKTRKVVRIMIAIKNISNFTLKQLTIIPNKQTNNKILSIKPQRVYMSEFRPNDIVHQIILVSQFNKDFYYIPLQIKLTTQSNSRKDVSIPISIDVYKFMDKTKATIQNITDKLPIQRTFFLSNKSELPFAYISNFKVMKFVATSQMQFVDIFQKMLENGTYAIQIHSNSQLYAQAMEEYLKFLYNL